MVMMGKAKTVTGLASSMRKANPSRPSKCISPMARNSSAKANLMGSPVQNDGQSTPSPIFVGDIDSRSSAMISSYGSMEPLLVQELSVDNRGHGEQKDRYHHDDPADQRDRALENIPLGISIDERERGEQCHEGSGQRDGAEELTELSGEDFQTEQLEQKQKVPLGLR